jgi:hypothetical protein
MKRVFALLIVVCASLAMAQTPLAKGGTWEFGPWVGGGVGLGSRSDFHFFNTGFRFGTILTDQIGTSRARGNLEWAADIIPLYFVYQPERVYAFSINPVVVKYNFTGGKKLVPFIAAEGGLLFATKDVPPGPTSWVNFTPGGAFGVYVMQGEKHAIEFSGHVTHISSAGLSSFNPGVNASLQFRLGYFWFK